uniref:Mcf.2 cell line derived transforming sequence-like a n=1 Tax=Cyprinus carpio TaxID=7962 RepID=A0A8C2EJ70_CYPCA
MQQESSPLCAADISPDLRKQFAFLSGGRGQNGSPIIIFPEYPAFGELEEQEFHNVLTYLTSIPSVCSTGVGFILVIDRRQDRWASVKGTLLRIAGSFPGNLQLVLVLRPTALFQRTISDIFFKLNKDEFKMKVPVIMLSSVTELHSYIDRTQLTQELGGTQEYCHEKWISHRTAIEGFALMVKKTAQTLQSFGTELAETELPNDVEATHVLKCSSTHMTFHLDILLNFSFCVPQKKVDELGEVFFHSRSVFISVSRLLGQLDETETAFDDFWDKHQTKLEQCLQLRHFEQNFREEVLDRALTLACDADQLIEASHYAVDSILPKCSELRAVCEEISSILKAKKAYLLKAMELHQCLEKATKWCDDGIYLLASQPVDKCQSQDGAESALQEIERFLETANQHKLTDLSGIWRDYESIMCLMSVHYRHVMNELLETERAYVEELLCVLEGYGAEMDNPAMANLIPNTLLHKKDILFGNMPEIYQFHKKTFLRELEAYTDYPELVGRCFLERMTDLQIYEKYCQNKPRSESLWRQCSDCVFFQECQKKLEHKLGLDSYLLKPVQRITKYQLLLKELLKYSKGCEGEDDLQEALSSILGILKAVNDSMHLIAITGYEGNLSDLGRLMMQGSFSVWTEHKKGHAKVKDLARFKPMQRHLFLHEKALLFCKKREENGEGYEKAPSYSFKHSLSMTAVGITENAKGDNKKFEIWCNSREEVFIVQAPTPEIKTAWVNEIRKVLTGQLKAYRGEIS